MSPPIPIFPDLHALRESLIHDPQCLCGVTTIVVASRTYDVDSDGRARDYSGFFEGLGAADALIERTDREEQITSTIRCFRAAPSASSSEGASSSDSLQPQPAAMKPAIATGGRAKAKVKKHVHFQEHLDVCEIVRTTAEVAMGTVHRVEYYVNLIAQQVAVAVESAGQLASLYTLIEAAAERAALAASTTGRASHFERAAQLRAAADAAHVELDVAQGAVSDVMTATGIAKEALTEANEAAEIELITAPEIAGHVEVSFLKEPIVTARHALRDAKHAARKAQGALDMANAIAHSAGIGHGVEADDSDDDLSSLAADFDRASLE